MWQVGNRYLCKEKYENVRNEVLLSEGEFYEILDYNHILNEIWVQSNYLRLPMSLRATSLRYIWHFFYTDKELRKLKLKRLKSI